MKIEKISETQMSFILSEDDLKFRNINIYELSYGSPKASELFSEILNIAINDYSFKILDEIPPIIEAIPSEDNGIKILITIVSNQDEINSHFGYPHFLGNYKEVFRGNKSNNNGFENIFGNFISSFAPNVPLEKDLNLKSKNDKKPLRRPIIIEFKNLDDSINFSIRAANIYSGVSILYNYKSKYYLYLKNSRAKVNPHLGNIIEEFGIIINNSELLKTFLYEYGKIIIKRKAIQILSSI